MSTSADPTSGPRAPRCALALFAISAFVGSCEPPGPDVVATAGEWSLTTDRMAELLVLAQPFPLDSASVTGLARHWVGAAAFAQRDASVDLTGEEATRAATWLDEREALLDLDVEDRLGANVVVDRLVSEVAFRVGDLRLFAHVLRRVGPETPPQERELQRATAQRLLEGLVAGGSWDAAVAESDDLDTRTSSGLLGLFADGELPPDLNRIAFGLQPGQVSAVVESPDGFHILYRPLFGDVAGLYASRLRRRELAEADAAARDVFLARRAFAASGGAERAVRRVAREPWEMLDSDVPVGTWDDGTVTVAHVARVVVALPDRARAEIVEASESDIEEFVLSVAIREIRSHDAEQRGLQVPQTTLDQLSERHATEVQQWRSVLGIQAGSVADPAALDRYMDEVVARRTTPEPLSPLFEAWLLEGGSWEVRAQSALVAIETARRMISGTG